MQKLIEYKPLEMVRDRYKKLKKVRRLLKGSLELINEFKISELDNFESLDNLKLILNLDNRNLKETIKELR